MNWKRYFPILEWLPNYNRSLLRGDLVAGLTVCVVLVPQGMAYAMLAGLPPVYGLYAGIIPLLLYAFWGTSRQLSVGPVALVSLLVLSGISKFAEPESSLFISLAILTALIAGFIQILLGLFRLGFLINFLSHPVIAGFTSAAALIIGLSQLKHLLGIQLVRSNKIQAIFSEVVLHFSEIHILTFFLGVCGILTILLIRQLNRSLPAALIAVILGTLTVWFFGLDASGISIVGNVPKGLPALTVPEFTWERVEQLLPLALTICLISFIESLAIAKTIESRHGNYEVIPNQELIALGITKIGGAFFQSYPTTGSFTRSAINDEAGANTGISSIISAILISLTLLFLTPLFYYLPNAILAAIIVGAVINLVNYKEAIKLWRTDKRDFYTMMTTFIITMTVGIQEGVLAGIILSLFLMVYHNSKPHIGVLGQLPGTNYYRNVHRFPEAIQRPDVLIVRFDAQLYFGNVNYFSDNVLRLVKEKGESLRTFILDASSIHDIDTSGIHTLNEVIDKLRANGVRFCMANAIGPVRDRFYKTGLMEKVGEENQFMRLHDAVQQCSSDEVQ